MKVLITNPDDSIKRGALYQCDIWIELDGNTCTIKKNTNRPVGRDPDVIQLDELPQFLREEKILRECRPELAEIKITKTDITGAKQKWQTQKNPYPLKPNRFNKPNNP